MTNRGRGRPRLAADGSLSHMLNVRLSPAPWERVQAAADARANGGAAVTASAALCWRPVGSRLVDEQWLDVGKRAWRAYDRRVRERFRLRAVADEDERAEPEEERSDYDSEVGRGERDEATYGPRFAAAAAAEGHAWSSYALRALQLGQPLREALRTASAGVAFDAEEEGAAAEPPTLRITAARRVARKKEKAMGRQRQRGELLELVKNAVRDGATSPGAIAEALGVSGALASVTLRRLEKKGEASRAGKGVWALANGAVREEAPRVKKPREAAHVARRNGGGGAAPTSPPRTPR